MTMTISGGMTHKVMGAGSCSKRTSLVKKRRAVVQTTTKKQSTAANIITIRLIMFYIAVRHVERYRVKTDAITCGVGRKKCTCKYI